MNEYRISTSDRILRLVLAAAFSIGGLAAIIAGFHGTDSGSASPVAILAIVLIPAGIFIYLETTRLCLTIDEQSITVTHAFSSRSILLDEIAGFRSGEKNGILLDLKSGDKPLQVPGALERRKELEEWLKERYTDIDAERLKEVTDSLLEDENLGLTREIRERRVSAARKVALYGNVVSPFLLIFIWIDPGSYKAIPFLLLVIPWIGAGLTWYYKGILRVYSTKSKPYPSLFLVVCLSEVAAFITVMRRYGVYDYGRTFWLSLLILSVLVLLVWAVACGAAIAGEKNRSVILGLLFVVAAAHSYSLLLFSNCGYDPSTPLIYRVEVYSKYKTGGKSTSYNLRISRWARFEEGESIEVPSSFYYSVGQGDSVSVYLGSGKWGIPWYQVRKD